MSGFSKLALFGLAGTALFTLAPVASAGTAELNALKAALQVDITVATSQQLFDAFKAVIIQSKYNTTAKYGVVAGEALKAAGANATDAGSYFATQLYADQAPPVPQAASAPSVFVTLAAKTAGSGSGINVSQISDLTAGVITNSGNNSDTVSIEAFAKAAAKAAANKPGAGAIIGGGASLLPDDATKTSFANDTIIDTKLKAGALDIVHYVGAQVDDSASYAVNVANANLNYKIAVTIATGAVAGDPTNAGNIIHNLFNQNLLDDSDGSSVAPTAVASTNVVTTLVKGVTTLAKAAATAADIEEIEKIGNALGQEIAKPSASSPTKGTILLSKAASIVKTLATAVMAKPLTDRFGTSIAQNTIANKEDEIAEVSAYVLGGLIGSPELGAVSGTPSAAKTAAAVKKAATTILALITNATTVKPTYLTINRVKTAQGPTPDLFAADVAASVALTVLNSSLSQDIKDAVKALLLATDSRGNPTTAKKINSLAVAQIISALNDVYAGNNTGRFEDGNNSTGAISDPETDIHAFNTPGGQS